MIVDRFIFIINQITLSPSFTFIPKTDVTFNYEATEKKMVDSDLKLRQPL